MSGRLAVVVGKGGVGRTTIAAGLALAAGQRGERALVVELNGLWDVGRRFGRSRSFEPLTIRPNVDWRSLTTHECLEDFGRRKLALGALGAKLMGSGPLRAFVDAVPGLPDLLQLGKIENLLNEPRPGEPRYDLVVVDAPATGHGLTLLSSPHSMTEISGAGPFHELARTIARALADARSRVVVATLPETLPLSETLSLLDALSTGPIPLGPVVVNRALARPLPDDGRWPDVRAGLSGTPELERLRDLADSLMRAHGEQQEVIGVLRRRAHDFGVGLHTVPLLPSHDTRVDPEAVSVALEAV